MRHKTTRTILVTTVLLVGAVSAPTAGAAPGRQGCTPTWRQVDVDYLVDPPPQLFDPPSLQNTPIPEAVSVLPGGDVRIAGGSDGDFDPYQMRYDGDRVTAAEQQLAVPNGMIGTYTTKGVQSFSSAEEGWLLPQSLHGYGLQQRTYGAHWRDGRWTEVPTAVSPDPLTTGTFLLDVASVSAGDAWSVGMYYRADPNVPIGAAPTGTLIERWDGTRWSIVDNPMSATPDGYLSGVTAISPADVWAVGRRSDGNGLVVPQIQHWDGTAWHEVPAPAASGASALYSASGTGPDDVWAVGAQTRPGTNLAVPLTMHWDGAEWTVTDVPDIGNARYTAVYAAAPDDVWAVGEFPSAADAYFLHWDGESWQAVSPPGATSGYGLRDFYLDIHGSGSTEVWAVGVHNSAGTPTGYQPIAARLSCERDR